MMWNKIWNPSNRKVFCLNITAAFLLNLFLEYMERQSMNALILFIQERTFVFLYNAFIIFITLSLVFLVKKKYFIFGLVTAFWALIGLVNGVILMNRNTPFTAVDLTIAKSTLPILTSYLAMWQILAMICGLIVMIALMVTLFLYTQSAKKAFDFRTNLAIVSVFVLIFGVATYFGVGRGLLISKFDNLIAGYKDYGVAYGFCITAIDTGIDRPIDYSRVQIQKLDKLMKERMAKKMEGKKEKTPNIIFIQLESFFDLTEVEGIQLNKDPLPNLHRLQQETTSGYVTVPVYGAGTINTEFEMITAMNLSYFGTGEYPYRSILHKRTCDSMPYWMKDLGYSTTAIHNNNGSFYDRDYVFSNLGFDRFITSENMNIKKYTKTGWAKDEILKDYIFQVLQGSKEKDYIYAISVEGHGDYPSTKGTRYTIKADGEGWSKKYRNNINYYANEILEMDRFLGDLTQALAEFPEETVLVVYGDHLPGLDFDSKELKSGSKYKTPYIIWDNFGYNARMKKKESENLKAYQLPSKVLGQLGISEGVMNQFHQSMQNTKNYKKNMKMFQYDLLYGAGFLREGMEERIPSELTYCMKNVVINKLRKNGDDLYILGANFNKYSRVYINGMPVSCTYLDDFVLKIPYAGIKDGDEMVIHQVSKTNENITYNESEIYLVKKRWITDLREERQDRE